MLNEAKSSRYIGREKILIALITGLFVFGFSSFLFGIEVSGEQFGIWSPGNNPYNMIGDITVPAGEELEIQAGVEVFVQGEFQITAEGIISALGEDENRITFQPSVKYFWNGIRLESEEVVNTFEFCEIYQAENGINSIDSPVSISNCHFDGCEKAINIFAIGDTEPPVVSVSDCLIENCDQNGIYIVENSNAVISNNEIKQCALDENPQGAIMLSSQGGPCSPVIENNYIHNNVWQGISAWDITSSTNICPTISDNEICFNLTGIYLYYASGIVHNNYIHDNYVSGNPNSGAGIMVSGSSSNPICTNNEITGNFCGFFINLDAYPNIGNLQTHSTDDDGENYIHDNIDEYDNVWSVYNMSSQDIPAENNTWDSDNFDEIAITIFDGNDNPIYGIVDFDPIYQVGVDNAEIPTPILNLKNYPNPFSNSTTISFSATTCPPTGGDLPCEIQSSACGISQGERGLTQIKIYNIKGQLVRSFSCNHPFMQSSNSFVWDGKNENGKLQPTGIYLYELKVNGKLFSTRRLILIN
jgi:hypothetical protein